MDLKQRKAINNLKYTKQLPKCADGAEWANVGIGALQFVGNLLQSGTTDVTADEMIREGGTGNIGGFTYNLKSVDDSDAMARVNTHRTSSIINGITSGINLGQSIRSVAQKKNNTEEDLPHGVFGIDDAAILGGSAILGGIMGSIGGNKAKKAAEAQRAEAEYRAALYNETGRDRAFTDYLRNKQNEEYGNIQNQMLYQFNAGGNYRNSMPLTNDIKNAYTSSYGKVHTPANANVGKGEEIGNVYTQETSTVKDGPNDTAYARLVDGDNVYSNSKKLTLPETGMTPAKTIRAAKNKGMLSRELMDYVAGRQAEIRDNDMIRAKYGYERLPRFYRGWENFAVNGLGLATSFGDLLGHSSQKTYDPNLQPTHKYADVVKDIMGGIRANPYPIMQDLVNQAGYARYMANNAGGIGAGQRTIANMTANMNNSIARANAILNVQDKNNQFARENAAMLDKMGTSLMDQKSRLDMFNAQTVAASNAKKHDLMQNDKYNILNYATQFAKNAWESNQFDRMMDLYWENVKNDRMKNQKPSGTPSTWSLNGDITKDQRFEKYAPTPFTSTPFVRKDKFGLPIKDPEFIPDAVKWSFNDMVKMRNLKRKRK